MQLTFVLALCPLLLLVTKLFLSQNNFEALKCPQRRMERILFIYLFLQGLGLGSKTKNLCKTADKGLFAFFIYCQINKYIVSCAG